MRSWENELVEIALSQICFILPIRLWYTLHLSGARGKDMIDQFTREEFEDYLSVHSPFQCLGLVQGEEAYLLPIDKQVSIMIRSSIKRSGKSAGTSKDSIRVWLVSGNKPLGSKISKWINRTPGWQGRLDKQIKQLVLWRTLAGDCKECNQPKGIFIARTEENDGRPFTKCKEHNGFQWLDEPIQTKDIYFSELSKGEDNENANDDKPEDVGNDLEMEVLAQDKPKSGENSLRDWLAVGEDKHPGKQGKTIANMSEMPEDKKPNVAQQKAIRANIDSNIQVLAGPGSGKTFVIEYRYAYLVQNDVKPQNIIVCTFGKTASEDMGKRIQATCQAAEMEQISTINAFCSRLLTKWDESSKYYKWQVPFDWKVKNEIEGLIEKIWLGEKPSAKEILDKINLSKVQGLNVEESFQWFVDMLGSVFGHWLYEIRIAFDAWLARNRFITFADQLYLVEQRLKTDETWRTGLQEKFSHVIIDESQDMTFQAMRILITISLEPGINTVYEKE